MGVLKRLGKVYEHADISISFLGNQPVNFKGIEYKKESGFEAAYGGGKDPIGYSDGQNTYSGSITLGQDELVAIQQAAKGSIISVGR